VNEPTRSRAVYVLTALGLLLVGALFLLLFSGALSLETGSPLLTMPAPAIRTPSPQSSRATVEGLMEGSGPTADPQEGQEGPPRSGE